MTLEVPYATIKEDCEANKAIRSYELPSVSDAIATNDSDLWTTCRACWHPDIGSRPIIELVLKCFREWTLNAVCAVTLSSHM